MAVSENIVLPVIATNAPHAESIAVGMIIDLPHMLRLPVPTLAIEAIQHLL